MMNVDFYECPTCAARPGTPPLCPACLHNRSLITDLKSRLESAIIDRDRFYKLRERIEKIVGDT